MVINRCEHNPIIKAQDIKPSRDDFEVLLVLNPGVIKFGDKTLLLLRVAERVKAQNGKIGVPILNKQSNGYDILWFDLTDKSCDFSDIRFVKKGEDRFLTTISHIRIAESDDGENFKIADSPFICGDNSYESFGVEDARVTKIGGWYYVNYSGISSLGVCTNLCRTRDFKSAQKLGVMFLPDNKDVTVFPKKIRGNYYALCRPVSDYFKMPLMWISSGKKLTQLGNHEFLAGLRKDRFDSARIGASCVPILTKSGWLEIYHGCNKDDRYCLGAMLLDARNPQKVLARSNKPILEPQEVYEKSGFMPDVIFSCGATAEGDNINIYYGACDQSVCMARLKISDIIKSLIKQ